MDYLVFLNIKFNLQKKVWEKKVNSILMLYKKIIQQNGIKNVDENIFENTNGKLKKHSFEQ